MAADKTQKPFSRPQRPQQALTGAKASVLLIFSLFWTGFFLFSLIFAILSFVEAWRAYTVLRASGVPLEAVIISHRVDEGEDRDTYYVTYQYTAPSPQGGQQQFSREEEVSENEATTLQPGSPVTVLYDPANPQTARLQAGFGPPVFKDYFKVVFLLLGLGMLILAVVLLRQIISLRLYGQTTSGIVIDRWVESSSASDAHCIAYRFQALQANGLARQVTRAEEHYKAYEKFHPGDTVQIRYLPDKPEICRLEF
jgi:hypothetical protein